MSGVVATPTEPVASGLPIGGLVCHFHFKHDAKEVIGDELMPLDGGMCMVKEKLSAGNSGFGVGSDESVGIQEWDVTVGGEGGETGRPETQDQKQAPEHSGPGSGVCKSGVSSHLKRRTKAPRTRVLCR